MARKTNRDKSGLSTKERKAVKNLVMNMSEPKQFVIKHKGPIYSFGSGGVFQCLSDIPLNVNEGAGNMDQTNRERLGNQVMPKSLQVDLHLTGTLASAGYYGRNVDYIRVVLFRHKSSLQRLNPVISPTQEYLWGETQLNAGGPECIVEPLNVFNNKDIEILADRKVTLTGDRNQYTNTSGTFIENTNSPQNKQKLLSLKVPFKKIVKKMKFTDEFVNTLNHTVHALNSYWIYLVTDDTHYGGPLTLFNQPQFEMVSRLNYRDIGA